MGATIAKERKPPMTVREACAFLGGNGKPLDARTVRSLCARGLIKYSASTGKWLLDRDDVETFVERTA